jgi:2-phosphosulfolactate phosphatase
MAKIHVLVNKEHVDPRRLPGKVVIVLDVLFATTSIVAALANGAEEVIPTVDGAAAIAESNKHAPGRFVLAGELDTVTLAGFVDPWPRALIEQKLRGKTLIYSTTNGTVALNYSAPADHVYAACLLNADAIADYISRRHRTENVVIVCSGSGANLNLEDLYGAGYLVSLLLAKRPDYQLTDAAMAARILHERSDVLECLHESRVGRMMHERNLDDEVAFSAQKSVYREIPVFSGGRVTRL